MSKIKIPFGKHKITGHFYDAGSVPNGLKCDCVCFACGNPLEAVHPNRSNRVKYFRHHATQDCQGSMESIFHNVAKQILLENNVVRVDKQNEFRYLKCDIEALRYGKRPDAYLSNQDSSLVVEIFFMHSIEKPTLCTYLEHGEEVLEIDISSERLKLFDYQRLSRLILDEAPRKKYFPRRNQSLPKKSPLRTPSWLFIITVAISFFIFLFNRKRRRRSR